MPSADYEFNRDDHIKVISEKNNIHNLLKNIK